MYKVFFLSKEIIFKQTSENIKYSGDEVIINPADSSNLYAAYQDFIKNSGLNKLIFICGDECNKCFNHFSSYFKNIEAAGGLVKNDDQQLLIIFRNGKWDLPKGKIEKGESPDIAAIREVCEETGLCHLNIQGKLKPTYHIYPLREKMVLKKTHWFEMVSPDDAKLIPQQNEGITKAEWVNNKALKMAMNNTYDSLMELMEFYLEN